VRFIFNLTRREIRSSWRRLLFFFICIALGVGSVVALRSLIQNVTRAVGTDARLLMTADVEISSTNPFTPADIEKIESVVNKSGLIEARNEAITTALMARPADPTNEAVDFVELKGVEQSFPLVGAFTLSDGKPYEYSLLESNGAVVARVLLEQLNVKVGDRIRIGEGEFEIRATFDEEPGGSSGFRLGPRVFIEKKAFDDAGITRNSSRVRRRILFRTSDNPTEIVRDLREALRARPSTWPRIESSRKTSVNNLYERKTFSR
jgi:putative ABC transport system permease protein